MDETLALPSGKAVKIVLEDTALIAYETRELTIQWILSPSYVLRVDWTVRKLKPTEFLMRSIPFGV
ncbi:MAG: hypothetical protein IPN18_17610 [Ignavibacteriales bacterium]|nr:hypothetical protein [Ignavibacteriales bacterium]